MDYINLSREVFQTRGEMSKRWEELLISNDGRTYDHYYTRDRLNPQSNFSQARYGPKYWVIEGFDGVRLGFFGNR